jgi:plasmid stabilization system protein ParE
MTIFFSKLNDKIKQISHQPESCPKSSEHKNLYKCVVTKQTTFYYRVKAEQKEIEIITFIDSRQHPDKLKMDLDEQG